MLPRRFAKTSRVSFLVEPHVRHRHPSPPEHVIFIASASPDILTLVKISGDALPMKITCSGGDGCFLHATFHECVKENENHYSAHKAMSCHQWRSSLPCVKSGRAVMLREPVNLQLILSFNQLDFNTFNCVQGVWGTGLWPNARQFCCIGA